MLEQWNVDGSREARLERNVPWMAVGTRPADRPPPQFGIVHEDSTGLLWIVTIAPADNWHIDPASELTPDDIFGMTTYHLDVIDPSAKEVVASEQIGNTANIPSVFLGIGRTALFRSEDSTGVPKASSREYALVDQTGGSCATRKR